MDNANAAASSSTPDQDKAAKDRDAAFERGTVVGFAQAVSPFRTIAFRKLISRTGVYVPYDKYHSYVCHSRADEISQR